MFLWQFSLFCGKFMLTWTKWEIWRKSKTLHLPTFLRTAWFLQRTVLNLHLNCCQVTVFNKEDMHVPLCMYMYISDVHVIAISLCLLSCHDMNSIWCIYKLSALCVYFCIVIFFILCSSYYMYISVPAHMHAHAYTISISHVQWKK